MTGFDEQSQVELEAEQQRRREAESRAAAAEGQVASKSFPRLRLNIIVVTPGYVTCSMFQSDNAGTNWACVGSGINFPVDWFRETFGGSFDDDDEGEVGRRIEFTITGVQGVSD